MDTGPVISTAQARALAARRKITHKPCIVCGTVGPGLRQKLYCSNACRFRAYRMRKRLPPIDDTPGGMA